jgi:hypothetical protein
MRIISYQETPKSQMIRLSQLMGFTPCAKNSPASRDPLHSKSRPSHQVQIFPREETQPFKLSALLKPHYLGALRSLAYGFTSYTGVLHSPLRVIFS